MGKDSLIKSTTKASGPAKAKDKGKKTATAKKEAPKKTAAKAKRTAPRKAAKAKIAKKAAAPQKTAPKPAPVKQAVKAKAVAAPKPPAKPAPPQKKPTIKELLLKKFDSARPAERFSPAPQTKATTAHTAPPFFAGLDAQETKRLKALLLKKFDLKAMTEAPPDAPAVEPLVAPTPAAAEAKPQPAPEPIAPERVVEPEPKEEFIPPLAEEPADPAEKILKYMAAAFIFLVILVIGSSFVNQGRYYLKNANGAIEIWQGKFAPKGQRLLVALPGAELQEITDAVYRKQDVYPIAFNYYIDKADAILDVPGAPNFDEVKDYLDTALTYATSQDLRDIAYARLNQIDLLILMYKADVAGSRGTLESLASALELLAQAKTLANASQAQQIDQKIETFHTKLASLKAAQAEAAQLEGDRKALENAGGAPHK
jgi:hypothetical protein